MGIIDSMTRKIRYILWLLLEVVKSSMMVTKIIWGFKAAKPKASNVKISLDSDVQKVVMANSITLTPGTISILLGEKEILVHGVLPESFSLEDMEKRVKETF